MSKREMSVAGTFYPQECSEIKRYINSFNSSDKAEPEKLKTRAIISPHAGYVYSGYTANTAYKHIDTKNIKRVIVIGPSHRVYLKGASIAMYDTYDSPCSELKIDLPYSQELLSKYDFLSFVPTAHSEHSTETQVPFVEHYFGKVDLVEIVYGDIEYSKLIPMIDEILKDEQNFLVISTDLSHFHTLKEANFLDSICYKAIKEMDSEGMKKGCEACGMIGVKALIEASVKRGLKSKMMDYRTSYDASSDDQSVVGYLSVLIL